MLRRIAVVLVGAIGALAMLAGGASADACPNEQLRAETHSTQLPDCRAYEMVSPADKNGTDILPSLIDTQSAIDGNRVVLSSVGAFAGAAEAKGVLHYIATRGAGGWSTFSPVPAMSSGVGSHGSFGSNFLYMHSLDLRRYVISTGDPDPLTGESTGLRHLDLGEEGRILKALDPPGTPATDSNAVALDAVPAGASDDFRHIVFESVARLTPEAPVEEPSGDPLENNNFDTSNVYENFEGSLRLVGILPDGKPAPGGAFAGYFNPEGPQNLGGASQTNSLTQDEHVVSADGSRVFWTSVSDGQLYVRINGASTVHISASQRTDCADHDPCTGTPEPDPNGPKPAGFMYATPDGSRVFFTSAEKLSDNAGPIGGFSHDLYMYDVNSGRLTDLSPDHTKTQLDEEEGAQVVGMLGASDDGKTAYFAAEDHLTSDSVMEPDTDELGFKLMKVYRWHEGDAEPVTFVAKLGNSVSAESSNWALSLQQNIKPSHVSTDGRYLLLWSFRQLTSYENAGHGELYRYDSHERHLTCISCNPDRQPATSDALVGQTAMGFGPWIKYRVPNNMSPDGSRIFFNTPEALVPGDTNGKSDVYEWENGQLHLISSGTSLQDSFFGDADPAGENVFFTTHQALVRADQDTNADLYDARVDGGIAEPSASVTPCRGEGCLDAPASAPSFSLPASSTFNGVGNISPAPKPSTRPPTAAQLRADELRRALRACRHQKKSHRARCEARARKRYGPRSTGAHKNTKTSIRKGK